MRVQDVMTQGVQTVSPGTAAEDAWGSMQIKGIHHLVVTRASVPVGLLSARDAGGVRGRALRAGRTVGELMTQPVIAVPRTTTVRRAANMMRGRSIGCLVVTDKNKLVGIVTVADLLELVGRGLDRGVEVSKRWTLKHRAPHRKRNVATGAW